MTKQPHSEQTVETLESALEYHFSDTQLLQTALTHTSFVKEDGAHGAHNERLEFLGDAVLELCVSAYIFSKHPQMQEGEMTRMRARLVCESALFHAALSLGVKDYIRLGHGEIQTGGAEKPSILADALEAVIGAIYLDGGLEAARAFVVGHVVSLLENSAADTQDKDYKTRLQELVQHTHSGALRYELAGAAGPEHQKIFTMRVLLDDRVIGVGSGRSKQQAGQEAAKAALHGGEPIEP